MRTNKAVAPFLIAVLLSAAAYAATSDLADAAMKRDTAAVRTLLTQKADVNATQPDGTTALHWAVDHEDVGLVDRLLAAGADAKAVNQEGATPLYLACVTGNVEIITKLLKHGADVNTQSTVVQAKRRRGVVYKQGDDQHSGGVTALILAARQGNVDAVRVLAENGADVNKPSGDGSTAMVVAIQNGHYDVARLL